MASASITLTNTMSIWRDRAAPIETDAFVPDGDYDLVVVGAGLTGLVTGLLFARAGMRVAVLEARSVGAGTTGNTTAKLSLLQGKHLSEMLRHTSVKTGQAYVDGNREGMMWLLRYCEEHGVPVQRKAAFSYASSPGGVDRVNEEYRAGVALGLDVTRESSIDVPFPVHGAVALADQAQFDPMDVLAELARDFRRHGGTLIEDVRVRRVSPGDPNRILTNRGLVTADKVVLATGMPIMNRGLYFAKQQAQRSYALAFRVPGRLPDGMFLSVDLPTRSVRTTPMGAAGDSDYLLIGGNGHPVGRHPSPLSLVNDLTRWTEAHFPGAERTHSWSAQDYEPVGRVPFVGWMPRSRGQVFFASGYDKWGMTNAVAASLTLAGDILGGHIPWAQTLHRRTTTLQDAGSFIGANAAVGVAAVRGYTRAWLRQMPADEPAEGRGVVTHDGMRPIGMSTVGGASCTVSAVCPHLAGVLSWNNLELSWDCPLHGSRFSASGRLLEGPATRDLRRFA
ncbi:MAG: FAD-dependent oxidoreductase [Microbacteriaceae bacterium]|jgi:glycine/D-amino acid oxidase-like deaminating enzyme/nitrite reductase/ring-hydroxylating ferredoxin subunit|nr:FAD-dependent oxidoreductase [Microbacteriaceae bacterium]